MEALATVVFERTPQGAVVIKSTGDEVPRRLRTLLLAVDGRSPVAQYVPFLTAFAPLSEKFAELEQMGYLRRKSGPPAQPAQPPQLPSATGVPQALARPLSYESDLNDIARNLFAQAMPPTAPPVDPFALELQALAAQMGRPDWQKEADRAGVPAAKWPHAGAGRCVDAPASVSTPTLQDLLREMEGFLSRSAGLEGLPVALMLEQITNLAQLRRELPSYRQLIQSYGVDAAAHGQRLASLLDQAGS